MTVLPWPSANTVTYSIFFGKQQKKGIPAYQLIESLLTLPDVVEASKRQPGV
jgi:hypothetical protein